MGYSLAWVGIRGISYEDAVARLALRRTGESAVYAESPVSARSLADGWTLVVARGCDHPIIKPSALAKLSVNGEAITLPLKEFDLLEYLMRNSGRVLTRGQLIDRVWGADYVGDTKTLDVHVKRLRAKLEPEPSAPRHLVTVRGLGYKLDA